MNYLGKDILINFCFTCPIVMLKIPKCNKLCELELFEEMQLDFSLFEKAFDWPNSYIYEKSAVNYRGSINKNLKKLMSSNISSNS